MVSLSITDLCRILMNGFGEESFLCYWKQWRYPRTKVRKLMELGIPKDFAIMTGASSKSYWHLSKTFAGKRRNVNKWLEKQGLINIKDLWCKT